MKYPGWCGFGSAVFIIVVLLAAVVVFGVSADDGTRSGEPPAAVLSPSAVRVGVPRSYAPHYLVDDEGNPRGFAIDAMNDLARLAQLDVSYRVYDTWEETLQALARRDVDVIPNVGISPERAQFFRFSPPIETFAIKAFVRSTNAELQTIDDLAGRAVATVEANIGLRVREIVPAARVRSFPHVEEAIFALLSSAVDVLVYPEPWTLKFARDAGVASQLRSLDPPLFEVKRAVAVHATDDVLLQRLSRAVETYLASDDYQRNYRRWLGAPEPSWFSKRIVWILGAAMGVLLLTVTAWLVVWRYRSIVALNDQLRVTIEQKARSEAALRDNEKNFRSLIQNASDGVLVVKVGQVSFANAAMTELLGYAPSDFSGLHLQQLVAPETIEQIQSQLERRAIQPRGMGSQQLETAFFSKFGERVDVEITIAETLWRGERANLVVVRDIRRRKRSEAELELYRNQLERLVDERTKQLEQRNSELHGLVDERQRNMDQLTRSEALLATAQRLAHIGAWEWVFESPRVTLTDEAKRIYGFTPDSHDIFFDTFVDRIHPEDRLRFTGELYRALSDHGGFDIEYRLALPGGETRFVHGLGRVVRDVATGADRVLGAIHDITESKQMDQLKREFVSVVSHELRTPLTAIRGALGLYGALAGQDLTGEARNLLEIAQRNSQRLVHLVNDILDIEKLEAGKMQFVIEPVSVVAAIKETMEANRMIAEEHEVTYVLSSTAVAAQVDADSRRLAQILTNLLSNAAKFSARGGWVEVDVFRLGSMVRVSIADSGCGIDPRFRKHIFQKFSQQDASDDRVKGGSGLGLAITKAMVEQMGGQIDFTSEPGKGATFFFDLPAHIDVAFVDPQRVAN